MVAPLLIPAAISIASEFFPFLATRLGGRRGKEIAETVVATAARVANLSRDATPQEIIAAVNGKPGGRDQLTYELEQISLRETELAVQDRQDARAYQSRSDSQRGTIMLIGVSVALAICVGVIVFPNVLDPAELTFLGTISGALLKMLSDAFAFEFGSSRGSKEKAEEAAEFKNAILRLGEERQADIQEIVRAQQKSLQEAQAALQNSVPAAAAVASVVATQTAEAVTQAVQQTRDFVAQLVSGNLEAPAPSRP